MERRPAGTVRLRRRAIREPRRNPVDAAFTTVPAPWGVLHVAVTGAGVVAVEPAADTATFVDGLVRRLGGTIWPDGPAAPPDLRDLLGRAARQLHEFASGTRTTFDLPLDLRGLTAWERRVLEGTRALPYGTWTSYGRLAAALGNPRAGRAVGNALRHNPLMLVIPCHRVLAGDGSIGGYGGSTADDRADGLELKSRLLAAEGMDVPVPTGRR